MCKYWDNSPERHGDALPVLLKDKTAEASPCLALVTLPSHSTYCNIYFLYKGGLEVACQLFCSNPGCIYIIGLR